MSNSESIDGPQPPVFDAARAIPAAGYSESAYSSTAPSQSSAVRRPTTPAQAFFLLLMINICVVGAFWVLGFLLYQVGGQSIFGFIFMPLMVLLPGLFVCMIVWHRGVVQAYAIGTMPALLSLFFYSTSFAFAFSPRGNPWSMLISMGVGLSLVGLSGLLCAATLQACFPSAALRNRGNENKDLRFSGQAARKFHHASGVSTAAKAKDIHRDMRPVLRQSNNFGLLGAMAGAA